MSPHLEEKLPGMTSGANASLNSRKTGFGESWLGNMAKWVPQQGGETKRSLPGLPANICKSTIIQSHEGCVKKYNDVLP